MAAADRIAELLLRRGDIAAQGARESGRISSGLASELGQLPARTYAQVLQEKQQAQQQRIAGQTEQMNAAKLQQTQQGQADTQALDTAFQAPDRNAILAAVPGHLREHVMGIFQKADEADARAKKAKIEASDAEDDYFGHLAAGVEPFLKLGTEQGLGAAKVALDEAKAAGHEGTDQLWQQIQQQPEMLPQIIDKLKERSKTYAGKAAPKPALITGVGPDGQPVRMADQPGAVPYVAPKPPALVTGVGPDGKPVRVPDAAGVQPYERPRAAPATNGQPGDVKEAIAGMKDGTIPPQLPGRASKDYTAIMAEAHRQGYDLATAAEDWTATQKHLATLNGAQQTRLRQAVAFTSDSLGVVEDLAKQWKAGGFPVLNAARLGLAKSGALGPEAASLATRMDSQISDLVSELGTVYKGGNGSTDESLKLAASNLKSNWSEKVLLDNIAQVRKNLQIRTNSIKNTSVAGVSDSNPYAPAQQVAPAPASTAPALTPGLQRLGARQ